MNSSMHFADLISRFSFQKLPLSLVQLLPGSHTSLDKGGVTVWEEVHDSSLATSSYIWISNRRMQGLETGLELHYLLVQNSLVKRLFSRAILSPSLRDSSSKPTLAEVNQNPFLLFTGRACVVALFTAQSQQLCAHFHRPMDLRLCVLASSGHWAN